MKTQTRKAKLDYLKRLISGEADEDLLTINVIIAGYTDEATGEKIPDRLSYSLVQQRDGTFKRVEPQETDEIEAIPK